MQRASFVTSYWEYGGIDLFTYQQPMFIKQCSRHTLVVFWDLDARETLRTLHIKGFIVGTCYREYLTNNHVLLEATVSSIKALQQLSRAARSQNHKVCENDFFVDIDFYWSDVTVTLITQCPCSFHLYSASFSNDDEFLSSNSYSMTTKHSVRTTPLQLKGIDDVRLVVQFCGLFWLASL